MTKALLLCDHIYFGLQIALYTCIHAAIYCGICCTNRNFYIYHSQCKDAKKHIHAIFICHNEHTNKETNLHVVRNTKDMLKIILVNSNNDYYYCARAKYELIILE